MASVPISTPLGFAAAVSSSARSRSIKPAPPRNMFHPYASLDVPGKHNQVHSLSLKLSELQHRSFRHDAVIEAKQGNPPIMPAVMTPGGPLDLSSILFRNRIIFIGQPVNSQVAQRVISQLVTLATVDEDADILIYVNCPGGSTYSVLAIYDCMSWIKPKVGTVCFGVAASQGALLLAGGEKGMRYAMPNARIMIHQPQSGCGGHVEDVRRQVNEAVQSRHKIDKMYAAFTGQPLEKIQQYTDRDRFFSASERAELMESKVESLSAAYDAFVLAAVEAMMEAKEQSDGRTTPATGVALEAFKQRWEMFRVACDEAEAFIESMKQRIGSECLVDKATGAAYFQPGHPDAAPGIPPISAVRLEQMSKAVRWLVIELQHGSGAASATASASAAAHSHASAPFDARSPEDAGQ